MPHEPKIAKNTTNVEVKTKTPEAQDLSEPILDLTAILTPSDADGWNNFMLAAHFHPKAAKATFKAMPVKYLTAILTQTDWFQTNPFMLQARNHPEAFESILKSIPGESLTAFLTYNFHNGANALMSAVVSYPKAVEPILKSIPKESLAAIMTHTTYYGENALMLAASRHPPALVDAILNYIPEESLAAIMTHINGGGYNALMLAVREHHSVAEPILKSIPKESLATVLTQACGHGLNALMLAVIHYPEAVEPILKSIPKESLATILTQIDCRGYNALALAERYNSKAIASILNAMPQEWLMATPPERLKKIVISIKSYGPFFNLIVSQKNIEFFLHFLAVAPEKFRKKIMANSEVREFKTEDYNNLVLGINKLPQSYKIELCKVKNLPELLAHRLGNKNSSNTKKLSEFMEVKIILELALLTEKLKLFESLPEADKEGSRFKVAQSLCEKLNAHFKTYLNSPQKKPDTDSLMRGFVDALSEKKNEILFTHRNSFWSLCQKIAHFILKLVGTKVTSLNQLPFKTDTANIKNRLLQLTKENPLSTPDNQQESMQDTSRLKPG